MSVEVAQTKLLLDALEATSNVKAVLIVDDRGYVIDRRGSAACLKLGDEADRTTKVAPVDPERRSYENLYIVSGGDDEFIIVVFDDRMNFERIKKAVDDTLDRFGLAPDPEE